MAEAEQNSLASDILATMGILITRRDGFDKFRIEGHLPLWYLRMVGPTSKDGDFLEVGEHFSFLESFLPTAMNFWGAGKPGRIRSGYWVEMNAGKEIPLKACAANVEGEHFLLIEYVKTAYDQGKGHLQKAREYKLDSEKESAAAGKREQSLLDAVPGTVLLVREDGEVMESHGAVPDDVMPAVLQAGKKALQTGAPVEFARGRAAPATHTQFWAVVS